jgi:hypothetical protein
MWLTTRPVQDALVAMVEVADLLRRCKSLSGGLNRLALIYHRRCVRQCVSGRPIGRSTDDGKAASCTHFR